jgi:two-component system chemotaxis response regulator CheY
MRVLIAEDNFLNRKYISQFMSKFGDVDITADGAEAVNAFLTALETREYYDLVCLDIIMPNMNGVEALQTMRALEDEFQLEKESKAKIIMMSALNEREYIQKASELGCNGYASKPVSLEGLTEVMKKMNLPVS